MFRAIANTFANCFKIPELKSRIIFTLLLLGICRVMGISLRWLLSFIAEIYETLPDDLNVQLPTVANSQVHLLRLKAEADEMWSFVGRKSNKQWVWIAIDVESRQIIAFYVGDRSRKSARKLSLLSGGDGAEGREQ